MTREFAAQNHLQSNSRIPMRTMEGPKEFVVRGIMAPGGLAKAFGGNLAIMGVYAAQTVLGRALYTVDVNRSLTFEGAVRQDGRGYYGKAAYSQALTRHWRATARLDLLGGSTGDFLGQYRRNSSARIAVRYSY